MGCAESQVPGLIPDGTIQYVKNNSKVFISKILLYITIPKKDGKIFK
jgi:hypothetical protein